ncbi:MAG: site-specific integrase [Deltaproteobacteria bacterium]|nr:site-specific integrase [Deltaproteobacteria bacterium]MDQ3295851.1 site-specific integrase [Myxococcota bacterium]
MANWIERWGDVIASKPEQPGVWKRRDGGFHVRGRATDPRTGRLREVNRALPDCRKAREAASVLEGELGKVRAGGASQELAGFPRFADYAVDLMERKVSTGVIASAAGREKWASILAKHLIPRFGDWYLDKITKREIEAWKVDVANAGYAPTTGNTLLAVLKTITAAASDDYDGLADAAVKVSPFETKAHRVYTDEQPNAFRLEDVVPFLDSMRVRWPAHYAMVYLGMWTGLRPSSLRPLRRRGPQPDIDWITGTLRVRRSHTVGNETMLGTKNGHDQVLKLSPEVVEVLRWHVERLELENVKRAKRSPENAAAMDASELLFPAEPNGRTRGGGFRTKSSLGLAFEDVGKVIGLAYNVTPRALRRSFQDLIRAAAVSDVVARAVCGHRTPAMTAHYSTVRPDEQEAAMGKIIHLATARRALAETPPGSPPERSETLAAAPSPPGQPTETQERASG